MLVLTRKRQEQIRIGDNITITILRVKGQTVRVGVEAPKAIRVLRGELIATEDDSPQGEASPTELPAAARKRATGPSEEVESAESGDGEPAGDGNRRDDMAGQNVARPESANPGPLAQLIHTPLAAVEHYQS